MARANKRTSRFARVHWIELGLELLARHGPEALTLERLTEAADKTRGSFYHHFEDHETFLAALGAHWLAREIDGVIGRIDSRAMRADRRAALSRHAAQIDHALERNLRRLAATAPAIADVVARSDEKRIAYLVRLFRSELGLAPEEALTRARIQHAYFVGAQMVFPQADARFRLKLQKTLGATLWRK